MVTWKMAGYLKPRTERTYLLTKRPAAPRCILARVRAAGLPSGHRRDVPPGPGPQLAARHRLQHRCHCHHYRRVSPPILDRIPQP
jgi:hypothetical protein